MHSLKTPVLLITYKRLETTRKVLESISQVRPEKLYVANNAPNPLISGDEEKVKEIRDLFDQEVVWPCKVTKLYRTAHLSARESISSAITWFFAHEPEGIILEDDCVVVKSFYYFAQECLERYRFNPEVIQISASNFQQGNKRSDDSYYFSRYNHIWGWAGWRRSWENYAPFLKAHDKKTHRDIVYKLFSRKQDRSYWMAIYDYIKSGNIDTWDYQWMFCSWAYGGISILPAVNMVENIGFGAEATNTVNQTKDILSLKSHDIQFPLKHPVAIEFNNKADDFTSDNFFLISKSYTSRHLKLKVATLLPAAAKKRLKRIVLKITNWYNYAI